MRSWIRLEYRASDQFKDRPQESKDTLCFALFRLLLSLLGIIGLSLLLLVIGRCRVVSERFETERNTNPIGLLETDAFFHDGDGETSGESGRDTLRLQLRDTPGQSKGDYTLFVYIYSTSVWCGHIMKLPST